MYLRFILIGASLLAAMVLDWLLSVPLVFWRMFAPVFPLVLLFWFFRLGLAARLALAVVFGFLLDVAGPMTFGTHIIVFSFLAYGIEFFERIFHEARSRKIQFIFIIVFYGLFLVLLPLVRAGLQII